jgi:hypothetical protein
MSNLTDLLPAGAGGKQVDFVATGAIGNGVTVSLKTDGTVEAITGIVGSFTTFSGSAPSNDIGAVYDSSNNKIVIAYRNDTATTGEAVVGTVSGTSISFGTPVTFTSDNTTEPNIAYDSTNNKVVISFNDNTNNLGKAVVGTVSGTSISFGTVATFESAATSYNAITYDTSAQKMVIGYRDAGNSSYGTAVVGTVSGTSISFGTPTVFNSAGNTMYVRNVYDSAQNKTVIAFRDVTPVTGAALVATVSGTSISFGSKATFNSGVSEYIYGTYDSTNSKVIYTFRDGSNSDKGTAIVGTVSGTSVSFGTKVVFSDRGTYNPGVTYDPDANKVYVSYRGFVSGVGNKGFINTGVVSGTSISFSDETVYFDGTTVFNSPVYDSNSQIIVNSFKDNTAAVGKSFTYNPSGVVNTNFIGISDAAISSAASGSVTIKGGISTNVTGLTANSTYYVQSDGTLATTSSSVLAGKALSSTSINLDYTT